MRFESVYPFGTTYIKGLKSFLSEHQIPWCDDPRTTGGDCYGLLISRDEAALKDLLARIKGLTDMMDHLRIDGSHPDYDKIIEANWDQRADGVIEIATDWKHLEVWSIPKQLSEIGIEVIHHWQNDEPPYIVEMNLIDD